MSNKTRTRRQRRYDILRKEHFTPRESRELSKLPKNTPALKTLRGDRAARWDRFSKLADRKIDDGRWTKGDVAKKWKQNLMRLYSRMRYRVQSGPSGRQQKIPKGAPNPWAMYRDYERQVGGPDTKGYVSPWEVRQIRGGKTLLDKGLLFVQKAKREGRQVNVMQVQGWVQQLDASIAVARGAKRQQLMAQRRNLVRQME